jgi:citrate lyase subunit beta/citryl-CoA lyase
MKTVGPLRAALFVPGNRPERIDKAVVTRADAVIIDLEDSVPLSEKESTRSIVRKKIEEHKNKKLFIRVNALGTEFLNADLDEVITEGLWGLMLPKVEEAYHIGRINSLILDQEQKKSLEPGSIGLIPLIETSLAVEKIFEIVSTKSEPERIITVAFGAADYALDMGIRLTKTGDELEYPRARIAVACHAVKLMPPLDTPFMIDIKDFVSLEEDSLRAKRLGFGGKLCIHPSQIEIIRKVFSPTQAEIEYAKKVIDAFKKAEANGLAAIQLDGKFIDYPVVEHARRILETSKDT